MANGSLRAAFRALRETARRHGFYLSLGDRILSVEQQLLRTGRTPPATTTARFSRGLFSQIRQVEGRNFADIAAIQDEAITEFLRLAEHPNITRSPAFQEARFRRALQSVVAVRGEELADITLNVNTRLGAAEQRVLSGLQLDPASSSVINTDFGRVLAMEERTQRVIDDTVGAFIDEFNTAFDEQSVRALPDVIEAAMENVRAGTRGIRQEAPLIGSQVTSDVVEMAARLRGAAPIGAVTLTAALEARRRLAATQEERR